MGGSFPKIGESDDLILQIRFMYDQPRHGIQNDKQRHAANQQEGGKQRGAENNAAAYDAQDHQIRTEHCDLHQETFAAKHLLKIMSHTQMKCLTGVSVDLG